MNGTHRLVFRLENGTIISVEWEGPETQQVKNWWVMGDERTVDTAVHLYDPPPAATGSA